MDTKPCWVLLTLLIGALGVGCSAIGDEAGPCAAGEILVGSACVAIDNDPDVTQTSPDGEDPNADQLTNQEATLPLIVDTFWAPSGYMGDGGVAGNLNPTPCETRAIGAQGNCNGFEYSAGTEGWAGVLWQYPENNWGDYPGKAVEAGATYVNVVAWVKEGAHSVTFQAGSDLDTFAVSLTTTLTTTPQRIWLPLEGADYTEMIIAFGWTADKPEEGTLSIYIDDLRIENAPLSMQGDSCEDLPCLHGGICDDTGAAISCDCSEIDFEGELCEGQSFTLPIMVDEVFAASGYTGDAGTPGVVNDDKECPVDPGDVDGFCHRFSYLGGISFASIVWQFPADNWGSVPGFSMPQGAQAVSFWAWGQDGGELVEFKAGLGDVDGFSASSGTIPLTTTPTRYVIDLEGLTYDDVVGGFAWAAEAPADGGDLVFFVDDIQWVESAPEDAALPPTLTFEVDMACAEVESYDSVFLFGTFNDWCEGCNPMQQRGESTVWSTTIPFWSPQDIEYKYQVDQGTFEEELLTDVLAGGTCAPVTDFETDAKRLITSPEMGDVVLSDLFGRCLPCGETLCEPSCAESEPCGDNGCGVSCGTCEFGLVCTAGQCQAPCEPACVDKSCGEDGCGGTCGACESPSECTAEGQCVCTPECSDKVCGDDGCGGICGQCGDNEFCNEGTCGVICEPSCADDKPCGDDGCDGICGQCAGDDVCEAGVCTPPCVPTCADTNACGDDGCGGSCGACGDADVCEAGQCITPCVPTCADTNPCGDDGCGSACGVCGEDQNCEAGQCIAAAPMFDVTFRLDMTCSGLSSFEAVYVSGPWEQWSSTDHPLTDEDGDGVWEATYAFEPGAQVEYKFQVDGWTHEEDLLDDMLTGFDCAPVTNFFSYANRRITVTEDMVVDDTYGACKACDEPMPPGVIFNVDMSCSNLEFGYVAITGPFSNWCGNCNQLSDPDGDGIYQATFLFDPGTVLEYKYQVDNWANSENLVDDMVAGATCAPLTDYEGYANRQVTVTDGPPVVVNDTYNSCAACP